MKKLILILMLLIFTVPAWAETEDISEYDGNKWRTFDIIYRHAFITGFMSGSNHVISNNTVSQTYADDTENPWLKGFYSTKEEADEVSKRYNESRNKKGIKFSTDEVKAISTKVWANCTDSRNSDLSNYLILKITNGQIVDGLNALYEDFKNRSIKIPDTIYVVKKQISGTPPEDIEKILLYLRSGKADYKQLRVNDEKGNFLRYISFP